VTKQFGSDILQQTRYGEYILNKKPACSRQVDEEEMGKG
jgi:hypothetical protein